MKTSEEQIQSLKTAINQIFDKTQHRVVIGIIHPDGDVEYMTSSKCGRCAMDYLYEATLNIPHIDAELNEQTEDDKQNQHIDNVVENLSKKRMLN